MIGSRRILDHLLHIAHIYLIMTHLVVGFSYHEAGDNSVTVQVPFTPTTK